MHKESQRRREGIEKIDHVMHVEEGRASVSSMKVRQYAQHVQCTISIARMSRIHGRGKGGRMVMDIHRMESRGECKEIDSCEQILGTDKL